MYKRYQTWDHILKHFLAGIGLGQIGYAISSIFAGDGRFHPVTPGFVESLGTSELTASWVSLIICGLMGIFMFYEKDQKNVKSYPKYFISKLVRMLLPVVIAGLILQWIPLKLTSILAFLVTFILIFVVIWFIYYFAIKKDIDDINREISK